MQPSLPTPQLPDAAAHPAQPSEAVSDTRPPLAPSVTNSNPAVAADEDVIEKEWVQRLKHIIATTKHDPFLQEHEISKLQADYLFKRYGKQVRLPTDE